MSNITIREIENGHAATVDGKVYYLDLCVKVPGCTNSIPDRASVAEKVYAAILKSMGEGEKDKLLEAWEEFALHNGWEPPQVPSEQAKADGWLSPDEAERVKFQHDKLMDELHAERESIAAATKRVEELEVHNAEQLEDIANLSKERKALRERVEELENRDALCDEIPALDAVRRMLNAIATLGQHEAEMEALGWVTLERYRNDTDFCPCVAGPLRPMSEAPAGIDVLLVRGDGFVEIGRKYAPSANWCMHCKSGGAPEDSHFIGFAEIRRENLEVK